MENERDDPVHVDEGEDKRGATAIEYGLLAGLIAVMIIAGATVTGTSLSTLFNAIGGRIPRSSRNTHALGVRRREASPSLFLNR